MALTPKQENFCRLVASGKDYITAYLTAYNWNGGESGAYTEAIKLANKPDIQAKISTLQKPLQIAAVKDGLNARKEQIEYIKQRIALCEQKDDEQSIIRYTDMLNKINALYKETDSEQKPETIVNNIDLDTLKRLSGAS